MEQRIGSRIKIYDGEKEVVEKQINEFLETFDLKNKSDMPRYAYTTPMGGNRILVSFDIYKDFDKEENNK